ncbi:hypothetical protein GALMADRAFT_136976 [Galerina marginata CBS 339.88]|uniref:Uncharacterized protein n=1 Tax=Galerina marginata (strain CBS 339.88) TaxID=685588 RepID=A0A067T9Q0_GALM3|nr:hypothetical protein GALMADRAFT_136976 [Galerina marginata CBS 339.88]
MPGRVSVDPDNARAPVIARLVSLKLRSHAQSTNSRREIFLDNHHHRLLPCHFYLRRCSVDVLCYDLTQTDPRSLSAPCLVEVCEPALDVFGYDAGYNVKGLVGRHGWVWPKFPSPLRLPAHVHAGITNGPRSRPSLSSESFSSSNTRACCHSVGSTPAPKLSNSPPARSSTA